MGFPVARSGREPIRLAKGELAAEASVGAVWGIIHQHVALGRAHQLPSITGVLSYLALAPAIGAEQAVDAIAAEHEAMRDSPSPTLAASAR